MMVMRVIGRIAFLLYAFMIAEGFYHIKDKPDRIKAHLIITERFAKKPWIIILYYIASALINYYAKLNYKFVGVLLIYGFYFYIKYAKKLSFWKKLLILIPSITLYFCLYTWARVSFGGFQAWLESFMKYYPWLFGNYAAMIIIASYNGKLGPRNKVFNGLYSVYYPLHMAVIGLIAML